MEVPLGLLENTATSKTEVDVSMWKSQGLLHFDNSLILLLKGKTPACFLSFSSLNALMETLQDKKTTHLRGYLFI